MGTIKLVNLQSRLAKCRQQVQLATSLLV
eukprot:COSAG01_NODE_49878_length_368_cov_0.955390_1_plen_28_part_10